MKKIVTFFLILILLLGGTLLYSRYVGTSGLFVKEYKVTDSTLPDYYHGFKIVHISDIHYGRTVKEKELQKMVDKINELKPDIVLLTGDLIDKDTDLTPEMTDTIGKVLDGIDVTIQKYAIKGNHDVRFDNWTTVINAAHFKDLNDQYDLIYKDGSQPIFIGGVSSTINSTLSIADKTKDIFAYLNPQVPEKEDTLPGEEVAPTPIEPVYRILMLHEPDFIDEIDKNAFNLIVAGHSHNGQVRLPFVGAVVTPSYAKKYYQEHYTLGQTELYISSGVGTSTVNFRLFNRPSINLYRLTNH